MQTRHAAATFASAGRFAFEGLERVIHERSRLGILSSLAAHPKGLLFNDLKELCSLTDGNLSRQIQLLQETGFVEVWKGYHNNRPQTLCRLDAQRTGAVSSSTSPCWKTSCETRRRTRRRISARGTSAGGLVAGVNARFARRYFTLQSYLWVGNEHLGRTIGAPRRWVEHFTRSLSRPDIVPATRRSPARGRARAVASSDPGVSTRREFRRPTPDLGANRYAAESGDFDYVTALAPVHRGRESPRARTGRFLDLAGIGRVGHSWPDTVFRIMRRRAGLELSIVVLVTAEIIAKVYYAALRDATGSRTLQHLCTQILRDERHHVIFQAQRVGPAARASLALLVFVRVALHRFLMPGRAWSSGASHGRAMRGGGMRFAHFWHALARDARSR
jgi:hypothetical protein